MQKKGEYCITAGEFAKMCQTTRDTCRNEKDSGSDPDRRCRETGDQKSGTFFISDADRSPVVTGDFVRGDSRRYTQTSEML